MHKVYEMKIFTTEINAISNLYKHKPMHFIAGRVIIICGMVVRHPSIKQLNANMSSIKLTCMGNLLLESLLG